MEREQRHFHGTVIIQGASTEQTIQLHAHRLHILSASIDDAPATFTHGEHDILSLSTPDLQPGNHTLSLEFEGKITNPMHGLYPCYFKIDGQNAELLATQFESHHAREVFPCIDEPEAKATFDLTLESEARVAVIGNTPIKEQHSEGDKLITSFKTTPVMSTYLLAWVAGPLDRAQATTKDGILVSAYATQGKGHQLAYALDATVRQLEFMNEYFSVPYPLSKCDIIALPDFSAGAMENWGCITFRENLMLVDEHSSTRTRQFVTMVVAHELAHQWFGDLVTMRWWNDLWLNESFANWMEYFVPSQLYPQWQLMTQYYDDETAFAIKRDSLASVQKIQQEVHTPEEIQALFDPAIVYAKGGSLINMLHAHLGDEPFRKGLRLYFERHKYSNTEANNLWQTWGETSGQNVMAFMNPWITQAGLPVITVGVGDQTVNLHQQRFFSSPQHGEMPDQTNWPIPLLSDQLDTPMLQAPTASIQLTSRDRPLLLNQGRTGYYLTQYDEVHMAKLATEVQAGNLSVIDRTGLLSDNLNLSEAGLQSLLTTLKLLDSYQGEDSFAAWGPISSIIETLKIFAGDDEAMLVQVRSFVQGLAQSQYQRLGWAPIKDEPYFDELLRPLIIAHLSYAEDQQVITKLQDMFAQATTPSDIWGDIRATTFAVSMKFGDKSAFDKLLEWYRASSSAEQRTQLAAGLTASRNPQLIQRALDLLTTDDVKLQDLFYWVRGLVANRFARDQTWRWMQDNWQWIIDHFGNDLHYTDFPKYIAGVFSTSEQLESYKQFFGPMQNLPGIGRAIAQGLEDIEGRIQWLARDTQAVRDFLNAQKQA